MCRLLYAEPSALGTVQSMTLDQLAAGRLPTLDLPHFVPARSAVLSTWRLPAFLQAAWASRFPGRLAANAWLTAQTWERLWDREAPTDEMIATRLVYRPLNETLLDAAVRSEQRPSVLGTLARANTSDTVLRMALRRSLPSATRFDRFVDRYGMFSPKLIAEFAYQLPILHRLEWVSWGPAALVDDRIVVDTLSTAGVWAMPLTPEHVAHVFERRPHLVAALASRADGLSRPVKTALAASRHLRSLDAQLAVVAGLEPTDTVVLDTLLANPVCRREVAEVASSATAEPTRTLAHRRLVNGTLQSSYEEAPPEWSARLVVRQQTQSRLGDTLALLHNPHLSDTQVKTLLVLLPKLASIVDDDTRLPALVRLAAVRPQLAEPIRLSRIRTRPWFRPWFVRGGATARFVTPGDSDEFLVTDDLEAVSNLWRFPISGPEFVYSRLGDDVDAWDLFLGLVPTYHGPISECVQDVLRLRRR